MFQKDLRKLANGRAIQYSFGDLSYRRAIDHWKNNAAFRAEFNRLLADAPFEGFRWETPSLTAQTLERPFEFVLLDAASFASRRTDTRSFADHFDRDESDAGIVSFENLGRDALLVVPTPRTKDDVYGHLATFVRRAPETQIDALWQRVGDVMTERVGDKPIWLSTAGGGVAWLHVRLDSTPKYYSHAPYRE